jgi:hypothetical protein
LIDKGKDPPATTYKQFLLAALTAKDECIPLHLACQREYFRFVSLLLKAYLAASFPDQSGAYPIFYASERRSENGAAQAIEALIRADPDVIDIAVHEQLPFHRACKAKRPSTIMTLPRAIPAGASEVDINYEFPIQLLKKTVALTRPSCRN